MSNFFNVTLDTTAPSSPTISLQSGATYAQQVLITATIGTGDGVTTSYQLKVWGDIDLAWGKTNGVFSSGAVTALEADALWITYTTSKQLQLTAGDGSKNVYLKIRDDLYNESAQASDSIILDTTIPVINISGPDVTKISKISGKNVVSFSFSVDTTFTDYKVKVVTSSGAAENTGALVGTASGSTNMAATGSFAATTPINCTINGADLEAASAGDGAKIIKVFVKDTAGNWSA